MSDASAVEAASRRLSLALDALEAATERRRNADRGQESLTEQVHALGIDRSQLASQLDLTAARAKSLEGVNREIARRLDVAIDAIRGVLETNDR